MLTGRKMNREPRELVELKEEFAHLARTYGELIADHVICNFQDEDVIVAIDGHEVDLDEVKEHLVEAAELVQKVANHVARALRAGEINNTQAFMFGTAAAKIWDATLNIASHYRLDIFGIVNDPQGLEELQERLSALVEGGRLQNSLDILALEDLSIEDPEDLPIVEISKDLEGFEILEELEEQDEVKFGANINL